MALIDYYNTGDNSGVSVSATNWYGQTFTASQNYDISLVKLKVFNSITGTINVNLYAIATGKPTGAALASATANSGDFEASTPGDFYEFSFTVPYSLIATTKYALVIEPQGSAACSARRYVGGAYAGGTGLFSGNSGSSWTILATQDFMFETYSGGTPVDITGTITGTSSLSGTLTLDTQVLITGTIVGTSNLSGTLTLLTYTEITGTISGTSALSGTLILSSNWQTSSFKTIKRLVAIGNDSLYYESV